jgi:1-pyrroline-5-carboxylate dehydrogenase
MLGQSKTAYQAEIDSACELIDFLRFNVHFAERI